MPAKSDQKYGHNFISRSVFSFVAELVGAIIASFLLALLYEGLKTLREYLIYWDYTHWRKHSRQKTSANLTTAQHTDKSSLIINEQSSATHKQNKG